MNMPRIYSQDFMSFIFTGFHRFSIHNAPRSVSNGEIARRAMHEIKKKINMNMKITSIIDYGRF